jgi:hypothetical protein
MTDSTTQPVPLPAQLEYTRELLRVYRTMLRDEADTAQAQQHLELGERTLSAVQRVIDAADKRARDAAAMPAGCPTPSECRGSACHGECLPSSVKLVAHAAPSVPIVGTLIRHALSGDVERVRAYGVLLCDDMETREPGSAKYLRRIVAGDFGETVRLATMAVQPGWIAADGFGDMPEEGRDVLIVVDTHGLDGELPFVTVARWNGELAWWSDEQDCQYQVEQVTYWQPLPEPPATKGETT